MSPAVSAPRTGRDASDFDVTESYNKHLNQTSFTPMPIAAILALCDLITATQPETTSEMMIAIRNAVEQLRTTLPNPLPATAGADVFQGLVGVHYDRPDIEDFELSKVELLAKAHEFARTAAHDSREAITELSLPLISDDSVILTHSYSRVVMQVLLKATKRDNKRVRVYVTESRSTGKGLQTYAELMEAGIPCTVILDSAVGSVMPSVNTVLVGAEGVFESGGILNALGTSTLALTAKACNKPFFVCAETFKFIRYFPVSAKDLPMQKKVVLPFPQLDDLPAYNPKDGPIAPREGLLTDDMMAAHSLVDYTGPTLISSIITDEGVLTPSEVGSTFLQFYGGPD